MTVDEALLATGLTKPAAVEAGYWVLKANGSSIDLAHVTGDLASQAAVAICAGLSDAGNVAADAADKAIRLGNYTAVIASPRLPQGLRVKRQARTRRIK
jgi:hypothetical protein